MSQKVTNIKDKQRKKHKDKRRILDLGALEGKKKKNKNQIKNLSKN